jgi:hypothetical protein
VHLVCRHIFFCINGVDGAFGDAHSAIDAFIGVDG